MSHDDDVLYALCCAVEGCSEPAYVEVLLYDVYSYANDVPRTVFCQQDYTCPYLCEKHWRENERGCRISEDFKEEDLARIRQTAPGCLPVFSVADLLSLPRPERVSAGKTREYEVVHEYPYSNKHQARGYSVYRPLEDT